MADIVKFPEKEPETAEEVMNTSVETEDENKDKPFAEEAGKKLAIEDEKDPLNEKSMENITNMLKNMEQMVMIMQSQWEASARELSLNDTHMRQLADINMKYRTNPPEEISEEDLQNWDYLNGIDKITDEEINEIFEEGHPVRGVDHSQTVDRIKGACKDFFGWVQMMKEYRNVHDAYLQLNELEEEKQIAELKERAEKEEDPEKKEAMLASIDLYYNRKYLKFLTEPVDDDFRDAICGALKDEKKVSYWIKRCRDKLTQLKISNKFILEIAQFEKRFLEEKYHKCSNVLLLYFMRTCIYAEAGNKKDDTRTKVVCMVMALDGVIRKTLPQERIDEILNNVRALEDQFIDSVPETK